MRLVIIGAFFLSVLSANAVFAAMPENKAESIDKIFSQMQDELMCLCGCNSIMKKCPHINCGFAIPARRDMKEMLNAGKSSDEVIQFLVEKHGEQILASPKREGFNLLGYIMPFLVIVVVGSLVAKTVSKWADRGSDGNADVSRRAFDKEDGRLAEQMRKELAEFDE